MTRARGAPSGSAGALSDGAGKTSGGANALSNKLSDDVFSGAVFFARTTLAGSAFHRFYLDSTNVVYEIAGSDNASPLSDSADAASDLFMNGAHRNGNSAMAVHRAVQKSK